MAAVTRPAPRIQTAQPALSLLDLGFQRPGIVQPRLIIAIDGLEKQGKNHFAFTAPDPIVVFSTDTGIEGVVQKFPHKSIYTMDIDVPDDQPGCEEWWERYMTAYKLVLGRGDVRTIIADTATELWELLRMAEFGKLTQVKPIHYGPVNAKYRAMVKLAYDSNKNFILLHKLKGKYLNDKRTVDFERAGFTDMGYLVQVNARVYRDPACIDDSGIVVPGEFNIYIQDCRQNEMLEGTTFSGAMCNFPMVAMSVLPNSSPEDWT